MEKNIEKKWFKRKHYGWGWYPATLEGWLVTLVYIIAILFFALTLDEESPPAEWVFTFLLPFALLTVAFIRICYAKGETPRWQWGKDQGEDTPDTL